MLNLQNELTTGIFLKRENRFVIEVKIKDQVYKAHLPNPGRLWELLLPGRVVYLEKKFNSALKFKTIGCQKNGSFVLLDTHYTNTLIANLIEEKKIPSLLDFSLKSKEVKVENSRIDLLLESKNKEKFFLEVKTCTLFGKCMAMFPDAVSKRASKHLLELARLSNQGYKAGVLFVVMNPDVNYFLPAYHIDPEFSRLLIRFKDVLYIGAIGIEFNQSFKVKSIKNLEIPFDLLEKEFKDSGAYLLVLYINKYFQLKVNKRKWEIKPGCYVYVGSAMKGLEARIKRHLRKKKRLKWHIDYLGIYAERIIPIPIRSAERLECKVANKLKCIADEVILGFGSTDCKCESHLFYFETDPILNPEFQEVLTYFRLDRLCFYLS